MIVLDSSFLVAFHNTRDAHHETAALVMARLRDGDWGDALLPEYVFLEVVTVLALRRSAALAVEVGDVLTRAREVRFVPCSDFFADTWAAFRKESAHGLSFTDAAVVAIARAHGRCPVATFDRRFDGISDLTIVR